MLTESFLSEISSILYRYSSFEEFRSCLTTLSADPEFPMLWSLSSFRKDKKRNAISLLAYLISSRTQELSTSAMAGSESIGLHRNTATASFASLKELGITEGSIFTGRRSFSRRHHRRIALALVSKRSVITPDIIKKYFKYDGGDLYSLTVDGTFIPTKQTLTPEGYYHVRFMGKQVGAHRIVYALVYGEFTGKMVVDHIDGNRTNNHPDNLRMITKRENSQNLACHRAGKLVGARWREDLGVWVSHCYVRGIVNVNGPFSTEEEAHASYIRCLRENNLPFIGDRGAS